MEFMSLSCSQAVPVWWNRNNPGFSLLTGWGQPVGTVDNYMGVSTGSKARSDLLTRPFRATPPADHLVYEPRPQGAGRQCRTRCRSSLLPWRSRHRTTCSPKTGHACGSTRCWRPPAGRCRTTRRSTSTQPPVWPFVNWSLLQGRPTTCCSSIGRRSARSRQRSRAPRWPASSGRPSSTRPTCLTNFRP